MISQVSRISSYNLLSSHTTPAGESFLINESNEVPYKKAHNNEECLQGLSELLSINPAGTDEHSIDEYMRLSGKEIGNPKALIENLIKDGILEKRKERFVFKEPEFRIKLYNGIDKKVRPYLHNAYACALENSKLKVINEFTPEIAHHFYKANNIKKSRYYSERAGDYLKQIFKNSEAITQYKKCTGLLKENEKPRRLDLMIKILEVMYMTGRWNEFNSYYKEADALSKEISSKISRAKILNLYGSVCFFRGEIAEAIKSFRRSEDLMLDNINSEVYAETMRFLGRSYLQQGKNDKAEMYFNKTLKVGEKLGNDELKAKALENLGRIYRLKSEYNKALEYYRRALPLFRKTKDSTGVSNILEKLGVVSFYLGNDDEALKFFWNSKRVNSSISNIIGACNNFGNIGTIYFTQKNLKKAEIFFRQQLMLAEKLKNNQIQARAIGYIGLVNEEKGNFENALLLYKRQLRLNLVLKKPHSISSTLSNIGLVYSYIGELDNAIKITSEQILMDKKLDNFEGLTRGYNNIGSFYVDKKDYKKSVIYFKKAIKYARKSDLRKLLTMIYYNLSECYYNLNQFEKAEFFINKGLQLKLSYFKEYYILSQLKINCFLKKDRKNTIEKINNIRRLINGNRDEFNAEVFFALWDVLQKLNRKIFYRIQQYYHQRAVTLYSFLYKKEKKFQFKQKLLWLQ